MLIQGNPEFKAMQKALDMLWIKQKVISNNLANAETPGYKAQSVSFGDIMSEEYYKEHPEKIDSVQPVITTDYSSITPDGNNVDVDKESLELWRTYAQYTYLREKISGQFKNVRYIMNNLG